MEDTIILHEIKYDKPKHGISVCSLEEVEVIGERTIKIDGLLYNQYLYYIINYKSKNGQPFVALNSNISLRNEGIK